MAAFYRDEDDTAAAPAARQRARRGTKKCGSKKKKHERSRVRQPYMGTRLSIPYLSAKFMR